MSKSIPVSEAAVLTLLLEKPDMPEQSYQQLLGSLKNAHSRQLATEIRQEASIGKPVKKSMSGRTGAKKTASAAKKTAARATAAPAKKPAAKKSASAAAKKPAAKKTAKPSSGAKKSAAKKPFSAALKLYLAR